MHPTLRIIGLIELAIIVQYLSWWPLAWLTGLVLMTVLVFWRQVFLRALKRSKWLLVSLMLIFAFTTPGEDLPGWPLLLAPTYEGLSGGISQSLRLIVMLGGLSALLGSTRRELLMSGIYQLLRPMDRIGLPVERLTARLWLTLHYIETNPQPLHRTHLMHGLVSSHVQDNEMVDIRLVASVWRFKEGLILCVMIGAFIWICR